MDSRSSIRSFRTLSDEPKPLQLESNAETELSNVDKGPTNAEPELEMGAKPEAGLSNDGIAPTNAQPEWVMGVRMHLLMAGITTVCFLMLMDTSVISTATPWITNQFHSLPDVGWYGSAYPLASAALQPLTGKFYQHFNIKWTFLTFTFIFEFGSLLCGAATSSKMLIVGRAVAGMGSSGIQNGAFTIVASSVPMERRPALTGLLMGISQLGTVSGPLIGGALTQYTSWRWCFYINLPAGGAAMVLLMFLQVPEHSPKPKDISAVIEALLSLDLIGFALFAPAAIQCLLALQYGGNQFAWNSATIIGLFCGAGGTFIVFLVWEKYKGDDAMIPFSMVRIQIVWTSCVVYGLQLGFLVVTSYYLPIYFQAIQGVSPLISGVHLLPSILSQMAVAIISGRLVQRMGYYLPWCVFGNALAMVGNGLFSTFSTTTSTGKWIGYQILVGIGRGIALQMPIIAVQNALSMKQIPTAMALIMFCQSFSNSNLLSYAEVIFTTSIKSLLLRYAPTVNPESIIKTGVTEFRKIVPADQLPGVLETYAKSIDRVFYLTTGVAGVALLLSFGMGFKDIRVKKQLASEETEKAKAR